MGNLRHRSGEIAVTSTHGTTYDEAVRHGREVLDLLVESAQEEGEALPVPRRYRMQAVGA